MTAVAAASADTIACYIAACAAAAAACVAGSLHDQALHLPSPLQGDAGVV